jgi:hypothetical protein
MSCATSRSRSTAVGNRYSSRIEFTSFSSVERRVLGGTSPPRWDRASLKKSSAESFHAFFVDLLAFLKDKVAFDDRKRLATDD